MQDNTITNSGIMPKSYVPFKERDKEWRRQWMDYCELIGREQTRYKKQVYSRVYRQINGEASIEMKDIPMLNTVARGLDTEHKISFSDELANKELKHFDFVGNIVEKVTQNFLELDDAITIESIDKESRSEFINYMTEVLYQDIDKNMEAHIRKLALLKGIELEVSEDDENAEEKKQAIMQELQAIEAEHNIATLKSRVKRDYRDIMIEFSNKTIMEDKIRFRFDELNRQSILDFMASGCWLRVPRLGIDYYTVDNWRQFESFWITADGETDPQKSLIIGRNKWFYPHEIIENYGRWLTAEEKEAIINNEETLVSGRYSSTYNLKDSLSTLGGQTALLGTKEQLARASNRMVKIPITEDVSLLSLTLNNDKNDIFGYGTAGKIEVTEAYYKTWKKVGFVRFEVDGEPINQIISEEILNDFMELHDIKEMRNVTKDEFVRSKEVNVVYWDFEEEIRWGAKINNYGKNAKNKKDKKKSRLEIYIGGEDPVAPEMLTDSQFVNKRMPVCGVINKKSRIKEISDYQALHDLCMNEMMDYIEKDMGVITFYNYALLNGLLDGEDPKESLNTTWSLIKEYGLLPYTSKVQDTQGMAIPQPISVFNASMHEIIKHKYDMAQVFKQQAMNILEITPTQPMVQAQNDMEQVTTMSTTITEVIYDEYREGIIRLYDTLIEVAKYAKSNKIDDSEYISASPEMAAYIDSSPELLTNRKAKVYPQNNPKDRRHLKELQQMIYMNTIEGSFNERALLKTANSVTSFLERSNEIAKKAEQVRAMQAEYEQKLQQDQLMAEAEKEQRMHDNKKELALIKAYVDLKKQAMLSAGFQDTIAEQDNLMAEAEQSFSELEMQFDQLIAKKKMEIDSLNKKETDKFKDRELNLKEREVATKEKMADNMLTASLVNKNKYDMPNPKKTNNKKE